MKNLHTPTQGSFRFDEDSMQQVALIHLTTASTSFAQPPAKMVTHAPPQHHSKQAHASTVLHIACPRPYAPEIDWPVDGCGWRLSPTVQMHIFQTGSDMQPNKVQSAENSSTHLLSLSVAFSMWRLVNRGTGFLAYLLVTGRGKWLHGKPSQRTPKFGKELGS